MTEAAAKGAFGSKTDDLDAETAIALLLIQVFLISTPSSNPDTAQTRKLS